MISMTNTSIKRHYQGPNMHKSQAFHHVGSSISCPLITIIYTAGVLSFNYDIS